MKNISISVLLVLLVLIQSCSAPDNDSPAKEFNGEFAIMYADGFKVRHEDSIKWIEVVRPYQGATSGQTYLLVRKGVTIPSHNEGTIIVQIPITSIVCTSTTHIPLLDYLDETKKLVGFPTTDYISSEKTRQRIDSGHVVDLGVDKGMNLEKLIEVSPSIVMGYTMSADIGQFKKIMEIGIPVIINSEYLERHPLGRAEWIKFMSLFLDKEKVADSIFKHIETEYNAIKSLLSESNQRPTVMSGVVYGDTWFLPGGKNYASTLLHDAGYHYLWNQTNDYGFLELSFESVFDTAKDADFWIGSGSFNSLLEMKGSESRYSLFKSFQNQQVYSYNLRIGSTGGNEFLELGYLRPDFILKDLVKIGHPELLPDYNLFFYKKLQ